MATRLPAKTFADYAAIAVCPVLIMLAVGSLLFFLLAIGYAGSHLNELRWTFFWFVLAMVLVSRIAIEKGSEHAWVYGLGLAVATAFMLSRYVASNLWGWCLLGLIWWASNKLTWDCTVIDEDEDASGEGLLQAAKLDPQQAEKRPASPEPPPPLPPGRRGMAPAKKQPTKVAWWERGLARRPPAARQPHASGLWVIYFSLAALPIFGLGQGLIPQSDIEARQYGFGLLVIYLAAALGLLLLTSFLGLRRYLRQRRLAMPPTMAATWLTTGTIIASGILLGCLLLPRPSASWSLTAMIDRLGDPTPKATREKAGPAGESRSAGKQGAPGQKTDPAQAANQVESAPGAQEPGAVPRLSPKLSLRAPLQLLRMAIYAALLVLGLFVIIKTKGFLLKALLDVWRSVQELWKTLFARKSRAAPGGGPPIPAGPRRSFASLDNPFASGAMAQMPLEELIVRSFNGLEAWAEEHHCGRHPDETPFEFAERVASEAPDLAYEAEQLSRLYVEVAYAKAAVLTSCRTMLEVLWSKMTRPPAAGGGQ